MLRHSYSTGPCAWDGSTYSIPGNLAITGEFDAYNPQGTVVNGNLTDRGYGRWSSNVWTLGTEANGGTARDFKLASANNLLVAATNLAVTASGFQFVAAGSTNNGTLGSSAVDLSQRQATGHGATGMNSFACGAGVVASGTNSFAANAYGTASGPYSSVFGQTGSATMRGQFVIGHGSNNQQTSIIGYRVTTSGVTQTPMYVVSATYYATIPAKTLWYFDIRLVVKDSADTNYAAFLITGIIRRGASGAPTLLGTPAITLVNSATSSGTFTGNQGGTISLSAGATNNDLIINVTAPNSTAMDWVGTAILTEVIK